jgi:hypothetical protein
MFAYAPWVSNKSADWKRNDRIPCTRFGIQQTARGPNSAGGRSIGVHRAGTAAVFKTPKYPTKIAILVGLRDPLLALANWRACREDALTVGTMRETFVEGLGILVVFFVRRVRVPMTGVLIGN